MQEQIMRGFGPTIEEVQGHKSGAFGWHKLEGLQSKRTSGKCPIDGINSQRDNTIVALAFISVSLYIQRGLDYASGSVQQVIVPFAILMEWRAATGRVTSLTYANLTRTRVN
jgi:hypothetical protein